MESATLERPVHQKLETPPPPGKIIFMFMWVCAAASPSCCHFRTGESWCEHLQKAGKAGRMNTVGANSALLFKQMFMNIFCHTCRVLIVIWLDGHMSLKVEDWIYGREMIWKMNYQAGLWRVKAPVWLCTSIGTSPGLFAPSLPWVPGVLRSHWENTSASWAGLFVCWIVCSFRILVFFAFHCWQI